MASKYKNGKIYRIVGEDGLTYIGSTIQKLYERLSSHKTKYNRYCDGESANYYTSFEVLKSGEYRIELIEEFACDSRVELSAREGHYIRTMDCVDKNISGRTQKESKKQYRKNNRQKIKEINKQYYQQNKECINQKHQCPCGGHYSNANKSRHLKSKKHQNFINSLN